VLDHAIAPINLDGMLISGDLAITKLMVVYLEGAYAVEDQTTQEQCLAIQMGFVPLVAAALRHTLAAALN
jgi:hypothetical protein